MERKIRLTEKDVMDYFRLTDNIFCVDFHHIPRSLSDKYGGNDADKYVVNAEFLEDLHEFNYFIKINGEIHSINKDIDYRTNWVVMALSFEKV